MKKVVLSNPFSRGRASNPKAARYLLILTCLVAFLGVQRFAVLSTVVDAKSPGAVAVSPSLQSSSACIAGALSAADITFKRPNPSGPPFSCPPTAPTVRYDSYEFDLSGCSSSSVTISLCGPGGCSGVTGQNLDTIIYVYRAGGGPHPFNSGTPCTNLVAVNDDASPSCSAGAGLSALTTTLGSGRFQVVVAAFSDSFDNTGSYNLYVNAPGCTLSQIAACPAITVSPSTISCGAVNSPYPTTTFSGVGGTVPYTFTHSGTLPTGMGFVDATGVLSGVPLEAGGFSLTVTATDANGCSGTQTYLLVISDVTLPCITDGLCPSDPTFHPANTRDSDPTGIDYTGPGGLCRPSLIQTATFYKAYELNVSGCTSTTLTATLCGSSPCDPLTGTGALTDPVIYLYRTGGLTGTSPGDGAPGAFDPNNPCTNLVAANNELDGSASSGGLGACSANTSLAGLRRTIASGSFVLVVTSFSDGDTGAYKLSVSTPGCTVGTCSAITGTVSGGGTICAGSSSTVTVTLSGGSPPYTVTLNNGGGTQTGSSPLNFIVSPAVTTTYSVTSATDSGACPASVSGSATVTVNQPPTTATVGGPQTICSGGTTAGLGGNTPTTGTASWSVVSGGTGTFNPSASTPNATFTHTGGTGPIVVRWTISNPPCTDSTANVTITIDQPPTTANAGPDQSVCGSTATLAANTPSVGTGTWSVVSGTGTFANSHSPTTTVTGMTTGANVFRWTIHNGACPNSTDDVTINSGSATTVSALGPASVWVGLKTSDDVGTKFDLLAEVTKNGVVIGSGQLNDVSGGSSGFNNAVLDTISLALSSSQSFCAGDTLGLRLSVRVAASSGHVSGTARLWFNDSAANSRFNATVNGGSTDHFLLDGFLLNTSAGSGPKKTIDVLVSRNVGGNPFKPFGTWTKTF
jgi:hypothetical protein